MVAYKNKYPASLLILLLLLALTNNLNYLVHLNHTINLPDEPETREKSDTTRQQIKQKHHDERVAEVQESRGGIVDLQFRNEIMTAIQEEIDGGKTGS